MSVLHTLLSAVLDSPSDEALREQLRDGLMAVGRWDRRTLREFVNTYPAADGPRWMYADWLEGRDFPDRAEFIRAQCRLTFLLDIYGRDGLTTAEAEVLVREQGRLAALLRDRLGAGLIGPEHCEVTAEGDCVWARGSGVALGYVRGFVERIEVPTTLFLERATRLFAAHPITAVALTDKTPVKVMGDSWWWADSCLAPSEPACLARYVPPELYDYMCVVGPPGRAVNPADLTFATAQSARKALSKACVGYGRAEAGLVK